MQNRVSSHQGHNLWPNLPCPRYEVWQPERNSCYLPCRVDANKQWSQLKIVHRRNEMAIHCGCRVPGGSSTCEWIPESHCVIRKRRERHFKKNEASKSSHRFGTRNWQVFGGMANQKRKCELVSTSWLLRPLDHSCFPRVTKSAGGILYTFRPYSLLSCWFPVYTLNLEVLRCQRAKTDKQTSVREIYIFLVIVFVATHAAEAQNRTNRKSL